MPILTTEKLLGLYLVHCNRFLSDQTRRELIEAEILEKVLQWSQKFRHSKDSFIEESDNESINEIYSHINSFYKKRQENYQFFWCQSGCNLALSLIDKSKQLTKHQSAIAIIDSCLRKAERMDKNALNLNDNDGWQQHRKSKNKNSNGSSHSQSRAPYQKLVPQLLNLLHKSTV